jgi:hypothetical protein
MLNTISKNALFGAVLLFTTFLAGCGDTYSRDDFMTAAMGKSETEITAKFGKPGSVDETDPEHVKWIYSRETFDLANQNRIDSKTIVIFEGAAGNRHVSKIDFS